MLRFENKNTRYYFELKFQRIETLDWNSQKSKNIWLRKNKTKCSWIIYKHKMIKETLNSDLRQRSHSASWILHSNGIFASICQRAEVDLECANSIRARCLRVLLDGLVVFLPGSLDGLREWNQRGFQFNRLSSFNSHLFQWRRENWCFYYGYIEIG